MNPIIKLSDNAAQRIKEIMSNAEKESLGVRGLRKSWWLCRYVLRYGVY
jgi:iron-sulfur cluster assembly protein